MGGVVRKATPGGGSSTLISICGANVWTAGMGPLNTPQSFGGEILLVELVSLEGKLVNDFTVLNWTTATEQNNDYFSIYRSDDGKNWILVEDILAAGTSNIECSYSSTVSGIHEKVLLKLEQTDFDGTTKALGVIELKHSNETESSDVVLYPNPATSSINFGGFPSGFQGEFSLYSINGLVVYQTPLSEFDNTINLNQLGLSQGIFIGVVSSELGTKSYLVRYAP